MQCEGWDGPCERQDAVRYGMSTAYVVEENNYRNLCPDCQKLSDVYWKERWDEYYSGQLHYPKHLT